MRFFECVDICLLHCLLQVLHSMTAVRTLPNDVVELILNQLDATINAEGDPRPPPRVLVVLIMGAHRRQSPG